MLAPSVTIAERPDCGHKRKSENLLSTVYRHCDPETLARELRAEKVSHTQDMAVECTAQKKSYRKMCNVRRCPETVAEGLDPSAALGSRGRHTQRAPPRGCLGSASQHRAREPASPPCYVRICVTRQPTCPVCASAVRTTEPSTAIEQSSWRRKKRWRMISNSWTATRA